MESMSLNNHKLQDTHTDAKVHIYMYIHVYIHVYTHHPQHLSDISNKILKAEKDSWFHSKTHVMSTLMIWEQTEKQQKFPTDDSSCKKLLLVYFDYLFCN